MGSAIAAMNPRLQRLGVENFDLRAAGASGISLRLPPDVKKTARLARIVGSVGRLELFDLEPSLVRGVSSVNDAPKPRSLHELLVSARAMAKRDGSGATPAPGLGVPSGTELVSCDLATSRFCPNESGGFTPKPGESWYYLFRLPPQLSNDDLNRGSIRAELDSSVPAMTLGLTGSGSAKFREITRFEWRRGSAQGRPQHFAFVVDGRLITFPQIDPSDRSLSDGIDPSVSGVIIEGFRDLNQAKDLAVLLRSGPLPASFSVLSSRTVPAR